MKNRDDSVWGDTSIKAYNYLTAKQINLHVDKETKNTCDKILKRLKKKGINTAPDVGVYFVNYLEMMEVHFFDDAKKLGLNPLQYSDDRLKNILDSIETPKSEIKTVIKVRDNAVKNIDKIYAQNVKTVVD